jgi:hypothetical protein
MYRDDFFFFFFLLRVRVSFGEKTREKETIDLPSYIIPSKGKRKQDRLCASEVTFELWHSS